MNWGAKPHPHIIWGSSFYYLFDVLFPFFFSFLAIFLLLIPFPFSRVFAIHVSFALSFAFFFFSFSLSVTKINAALSQTEHPSFSTHLTVE